MKYLSILLVLSIFISCKKEKEEVITPIEEQKKEVIVKDFGLVFNDFNVLKDTVKSGDVFGTMMDKYIFPDSLNVHQITQKVRDSFNLRSIKVGKPYFIFLDKENPKNIKAFVYVKDKIHYTLIDFRDSVRVINKERPTTIKRRTIAAKIEGSLSETLSKAGVSASLAPKLASVYAYSIDFFKIQKDDNFAVTIYERFIEDSIYVGIEKVESSFFEHKGKKYYAFPYKTADSQKEYSYYDENGRGLKSMFLKAPLDFFRISSKFSGRRFHPVQQRWKAHNGTDYAAAHGTPIKTTASGVVERTGYTAGNGNYVKVRHNGTYSTQYLHMSKILVKRGQHVVQGQVIGKVGSTGLATGPHVCYRFWKNGVQVDPLRLKLPNTEPMNDKVKGKFLQYIKPLKEELDNIEIK